VAGLNALYGVVPVASTTLFTFKPAADAAPIDLGGLVKGPDGAPYVLDRSTKTVYRIDLKNKKATLVARAGSKAGGTTVATPRFLAVGGQDVLILDSKNVLWRWRSSNATGKGTLVKVTVQGSSSWGDDVTAIGTYLQDASRGLYKLYVVDPSEQQIHAYSPAADGGGFPAKPIPWLATARDVSGITSLLIDGDLYATENGLLEKYTSGKDNGWKAKPPGDDLLRSAPMYTLSSGANLPADRDKGEIYVYDGPNDRIVAIEKASSNTSGAYKAQYRLAGNASGWDDLRGMVVTPGAEGTPGSVLWISADGLHQASLEAVPDEAASPSASPSAAPSASPKATAKPTKKP